MPAAIAGVVPHAQLPENPLAVLVAPLGIEGYS